MPTQVCNFVHVQALRSAPKDWWCKPAALPAAARKLQQPTAARTTTARVTTPLPPSATAKRKQAHKPACTTAKIKASAKPSADSTATPPADPNTAAGARVLALPATAPAALKQAGKRKSAASAAKQAKKVMKTGQEPNQQPEAKPVVTESANQAAAPEPSGILEAPVLALSSVPADRVGIPSVTDSDAVVQSLAAPTTEVLPALLQAQPAGAADGSVPPNKRARTATGKAGSGQDASSASAFTARALAELMNDDVLTEALQDLLIAIGVYLPSQYQMQVASTASATQLGNTAGDSAVAPHAINTVPQIGNPEAQHDGLHPAGSNVGPGHGSAETMAAATDMIKPEDAPPTAAVATVASAESAPATAAVDPAAAAPARTAMGPLTGAPDHQAMPSTDAVATASAAFAAGPLSEVAMPASAAQPDSAPAQHANAGKHTGSKRLRGKASVLAKALGLNKSRAVKQHAKCAQPDLNIDIQAGETLRQLYALPETGIVCIDSSQAYFAQVACRGVSCSCVRSVLWGTAATCIPTCKFGKCAVIKSSDAETQCTGNHPWADVPALPLWSVILHILGILVYDAAPMAGGVAAGLQAAVWPALQGALADLGLTPHQLHRIDTQLVKELLPAHVKQGAVTFKVTGKCPFV